jgi:hypothetical protein
MYVLVLLKGNFIIDRNIIIGMSLIEQQCETTSSKAFSLQFYFSKQQKNVLLLLLVFSPIIHYKLFSLRIQKNSIIIICCRFSYFTEAAAMAAAGNRRLDCGANGRCQWKTAKRSTLTSNIRSHKHINSRRS